MRGVIKSSFLWQFVGGFVIGAVGLVTRQPADATQTLTDRVAAVMHGTR